MGLMQTEMPRNYTVPAKEQVRKLFVFVQRAICKIIKSISIFKNNV